jgi:hypothetical protein
MIQVDKGTRVQTNSEASTISVELTAELGGGHYGQMTVNVKLKDMTPLDISQIHSHMDSVAKQIVYSIARHAIDTSS